MQDYFISIFYSEEDGGYIADIPDLRFCSAFGATPEEALREVQVAKVLWLETARNSDKAIPRPKYRPAIYQLDAPMGFDAAGKPKTPMTEAPKTGTGTACRQAAPAGSADDPPGQRRAPERGVWPAGNEQARRATLHHVHRQEAPRDRARHRQARWRFAAAERGCVAVATPDTLNRAPARYH